MKYLRPENLYAVAERLWNVQIENRDALKLIVEMDSPTALFYLDPPYPASTRTDKNRYTCEMSDNDHRHLGELLLNLKGNIVLSGYQCTLYKELFEDNGWQRIDKKTMANGEIKRIESLWLPPHTAHGNLRLVNDVKTGAKIGIRLANYLQIKCVLNCRCKYLNY